MKLSNIWCVHVAALIAFAGVIIHVGAVFVGPSWFEFFNAPPRVVTSAREGTWLAPVSALVIAGLMAMCTMYAVSVIGLVRRPPLQRLGLVSIAAVCLLRALILPLLAINHPELRNTFEVVAAIVWFVAGVGFVVGFRIAKVGPNDSSKPTPLCGAA
ncbi:hypothetical protein LPB67_09610 [Undibacterium sp. Jales W-56]|uniref:hypothetical protein n=1 Tax=Undibacterium sp. Jales W-56 TaxID=2897325 RepID=UPI0021D35363|nr:hypothetical protein [Undibacterium sp. Jales W-56]MCU6434022.1 hypothetical protein [Undibacterium sp. Jales W-56]